MNYLKIGGLLAVVLLVLGVFWHYQGLEKDNKTLVANSARQEVVIEAQDSSIKTGEKIAEVKEKTNVAVVVETAKIVKKQQGIVQKVAQQEAGIKARYDMLPLTPASINVRAQLLSENQLDGLWAAYCNGSDSPECNTPSQPTVQPTSPGEPHA